MGRVTIKDVAAIAGVSPTAVSLAMNGKPGISDATREKILQIVKQMEFTPNETSRRLLSQRTGNIALLIGGTSSLLTQSFYSELNYHLLKKCEPLRYNVIYCMPNVEDDSTVALPNVIKSRDVDGILVMGYLEPRIIRKMVDMDIPITIVDNYTPEPDVSHVVFDYFQATVSAAEHLIACGHRQIGYIGSELSVSSYQYFSQQTFLGFKTVLETLNLPVPVSWMQLSAYDENSAGLEMDKILKFKPCPTAVLCSADIYAIGVMRSIKSHGLRVPDDISVIGIDDILTSQYVEPALTTIRIDRQALAPMAIAHLVEGIEQGR